jgi:DNA replication protein DnaC
MPRARVPLGPAHPLLPKLKELRLGGMAQTLELRAAQAAQQNLAPAEFLALLLDDEIERRQQGRLALHLAEAGWEEGKTLARFDFAAAPTLNRTRVADLATCAFVERRENLLLCGPTGVGKSHLAHALTYETVRRGYRALVRPAHRLLADLHAARADGSFARKLAKLSSVDLLVLDDFGLRPLSPQAIDDLYEVITLRYERRSIAITSNRALDEWPEVFGQGLLASAALDRLTHHAQILIVQGRSYRQLGRQKGDVPAEPLTDTNPEGEP